MDASQLTSLEYRKRIMNAFTARNKRPICTLDFEFNNSQEPVLNLVCCSLMVNTDIKVQLSPEYLEMEPFDLLELWLLRDNRQKENLLMIIEELRKKNTVMVAFGSAAEARSFEALGMDPHLFTWIDNYAEWRQLTFNNYSCQYGTYFSETGYQRRSVPPSYNKERNKSRDNNEVGKGMVACVGQMFGIFIDSIHKTRMRDLILENREVYTEDEKTQIMTYCTSDILYLPAILEEQTNRLMRATSLTIDQIFTIQARRGHYISSVAKMESEGMPANRSKIEALRHNFDTIQDEILTDLVENHYPFYQRERKNARELIGSWVDKYDKFVEFVTAKGLYKDWPRSINADTKKKTKNLCRKDDILEKYDGIPEIYAYRQARKSLKQLAWFKTPNEKQLKEDGDFFDSMGSDDSIRTFIGAYGTQTSRNAPKAKRFVLAMSAWLRCVIQPPEGYAIIAIDYAAQEFGIAAVLSMDPNMIEGYKSGDPYLYFAKKAGSVPEEAGPQTCKNPGIIIKECIKIKWPDKEFHGPLNKSRIGQLAMDFPKEVTQYLQYVEYSRQRDLFKATTLGLQYGMGFANLAIKLSSDMGEIITEATAKKLIGLHKRTYPVYWSWLDTIEKEYRRNKVLFLWDGWALLGDNTNMLSVKNLPTQGTGSAIMREAVRLSHEIFLRLVAPLHDQLFAKCKVSEIEETKKALSECMTKAFQNVLGDVLQVRVDVDVHTHEKVWIDKKGAKYYHLLKKYLVKMDAKEDRLEKLKQTIYSNRAA